jgi:aminoglycoside phosphotransferase family enzyme
MVVDESPSTINQSQVEIQKWAIKREKFLLKCAKIGLICHTHGDVHLGNIIH